MTPDTNGPWNWLRSKLSVEDFQRLSAQVADLHKKLREFSELRAAAFTYSSIQSGSKVDPEPSIGQEEEVK